MRFNNRNAISRCSRKPPWPYTINRASAQAHGLIGWWPMALPGGETLIDLVGGRNGEVLNGPAWTSGLPGGTALNFDGSDDYVSMGDAFDMHTSDWTVSCWFQSTDSDFSLISKSFFGGASYRWFLVYQSGSLIAGFHGTSSVTVQWTTTSILDGHWHLATATYRRSGNITLFVDGVSRAAADISGQSGVDLDSSYYLFLGRYNDNTTGQIPHPSNLKLAGNMDDTRIYARALPAAVVWQMFDPATRFELYRPLQRTRTHLKYVSLLRMLAVEARRDAILQLVGSNNAALTVDGSL